MQQVDFDAQCATADRIFVGTVHAVAARKNPRAPQYFETIVTFAVDEVVAGTVPPEIDLRLTGGTIGDEQQSIDGMPDFEVGERYVVMLEADQARPLVSPFVGFNQGVYRVLRDARGAYVGDRHGLPLPQLATSVAGAAAETYGRPAGHVDLAAFVAGIRAARAR
ncbi:MAG: hypothetical protein HY271_02165 [Deltaproteobacteria bacterium]|nr:hypothetical protein [Deltaproteobacteria bacterium]